VQGWDVPRDRRGEQSTDLRVRLIQGTDRLLRLAHVDRGDHG
jgi:hypothetical protein